MEFNVMLAKPAETNPDYRNGKAMMIQPKLDGVRCYITRSGAYSRNHKTFYNVNSINL